MILFFFNFRGCFFLKIEKALINILLKELIKIKKDAKQ